MSSRGVWTRIALASMVIIGALWMPGCSKKRTRVVRKGMDCISVEPASGPTSGGTVVTIFGRHFDSGAIVLFEGTEATGVVVASKGKEITCLSPPGAPGFVDVVVWNPNGTGCRIVDGFQYTGPPITGCTPCFTVSPRCVTLIGGDSVRLAAGCGADFDTTTVVLLDGVAQAYTLVSPLEIEFSAPPLASGEHPIQVLDTWGQWTFDGALVAVDCAGSETVVCEIDPPSTPSAGSIVARVRGCGPLSGAPDFGVWFGAEQATILSGGLGGTGLVVTVARPAPCATWVDVRLVFLAGGETVLKRAFEYLPAFGDPVMSGLSPASGLSAGGETITISGTDFPASPLVYFGSSLGSVQSASSSQIVVLAPASTGPGRVDVSVEDPAGGCPAGKECAYEYLP